MGGARDSAVFAVVWNDVSSRSLSRQSSSDRHRENDILWGHGSSLGEGERARKSERLVIFTWYGRHGPSTSHTARRPPTTVSVAMGKREGGGGAGRARHQRERRLRPDPPCGKAWTRSLEKRPKSTHVVPELRILLFFLQDTSQECFRLAWRKWHRTETLRGLAFTSFPCHVPSLHSVFDGDYDYDDEALEAMTANLINTNSLNVLVVHMRLNFPGTGHLFVFYVCCGFCLIQSNS